MKNQLKLAILAACLIFAGNSNAQGYKTDKEPLLKTLNGIFHVMLDESVIYRGAHSADKSCQLIVKAVGAGSDRGIELNLTTYPKNGDGTIIYNGASFKLDLDDTETGLISSNLHPTNPTAIQETPQWLGVIRQSDERLDTQILSIRHDPHHNLLERIEITNVVHINGQETSSNSIRCNF